MRVMQQRLKQLLHIVLVAGIPAAAVVDIRAAAAVVDIPAAVVVDIPAAAVDIGNLSLLRLSADDARNGGA